MKYLEKNVSPINVPAFCRPVLYSILNCPVKVPSDGY